MHVRVCVCVCACVYVRMHVCACVRVCVRSTLARENTPVTLSVHTTAMAATVTVATAENKDTHFTPSPQSSSLSAMKRRS